jgi:hypothetical protein
VDWSPNAKQEKFLALPDKIFEGFYGGGAFGGKTEVLGLLPILRGFHNHPRFKGLLLRRTTPELEREIIPRMDPYYRSCGGLWNDNKKRWKFPSGALIFAGHMEHEDDKYLYDTDEFQYIGWDELTSFTESQYLYLIGSRIRSSVSDLPAFSRAGSNPGNEGHDWVKKRWRIEEITPQTIIKDKLSGKLRIFIPALYTDNTKVPREKLLEYEASLDLLPEHERQAKKFGSWSSFEGQVFTTFRKVRLPGEPENALHVIKPIRLPNYYPGVLALDWGFRAYFYALFGRLAPTGCVYAVWEYAEKQKLTSEAMSEIYGRLRNESNIRGIVVDPATKQEQGEPLTKFDQIYNALKPLGFDKFLHTANNDRIGGKSTLQEYLRWKPIERIVPEVEDYDDEYAQYLLRWNGLDAYHDYLTSFTPPEPETNLPKLQIFETCPVLIDTIPRCIYNPIGHGNREDVKEFNGDDSYDGVRYFLKEVQRLLTEVRFEDQRITEEAKILQQFEKTKDFNYLAQQARRLRELQRKRNLPVRRFHGSRNQRYNYHVTPVT